MQNDNWLIVLDNVEDKETVHNYIPDGNGKLIITTRNKKLGIGDNLDLSLMEEAEAVEFLSEKTKKTDNESKEKFKELAEKLGYLPLALEQAAAYIYNSEESVEEYIKLFDKQKLKIFQKGAVNKSYEINVATTWEVSLEEIKKEQPAAIEILNICAFLAPDDISLYLFTEGLEQLPDSLKAVIADEMEFNDCKVLFNNYSMVTLSKEDNTLSIHRLVQEVIKNRIEEDNQKHYAQTALTLVNELFRFEYHEVDSWGWCSFILPHANAVINNTNDLKIDSEQKAYLLHKAGRLYERQGSYDEALEFYKKSLEIKLKTLGEEHPSTATTYDNIGQVHSNKGSYDEALKFYKKSLEITLKILGDENPSTATTYNNIGQVHSNKDSYDEALKFYKKSLEIKLKILGDEHPSTAATYHNIGTVYYIKKQYNKAHDHITKAINIFKHTLPAEHPHIINAQGWLDDVKKEM